MRIAHAVPAWLSPAAYTLLGQTSSRPQALVWTPCEVPLLWALSGLRCSVAPAQTGLLLLPKAGPRHSGWPELGLKLLLLLQVRRGDQIYVCDTERGNVLQYRLDGNGSMVKVSFGMHGHGAH